MIKETKRETWRVEDSTRLLQFAESISKILATIAIPVVLAVGGWYIQDSVSRQSVNKDYVALAVSILQKHDADPNLRSWAVRLLNDNSPTKFSDQTFQDLLSGAINFASIGAAPLAVSPDAKHIAVGAGNGIAIYDAATADLTVSLRGDSGRVVALAYAPDGAKLYSGSLDSTVRVWDPSTGRILAALKQERPVIGLAVSLDGQSLFVRLEDGAIKVFGLANLQLMGTIRVSPP